MSLKEHVSATPTLTVRLGWGFFLFVPKWSKSHSLTTIYQMETRPTQTKTRGFIKPILSLHTSPKHQPHGKAFIIRLLLSENKYFRNVALMLHQKERKQPYLIDIQPLPFLIKYPDPGSNRDGFPHWCLRPARLPIPPSGLN